MVNYFKVFIGEGPEDANENEETKGEDKASGKKDFKIMSELHSATRNMRNNEQTSFEDILFCFLDKVFDKFAEEKLVAQLPNFIREMSKSKTIGKAGFTNGVSRFV